MIARYILLLTQFVAGEITADQFEHSYLEMFKSEKEKFPENVYEVLNNLFLDVDAYCGDPSLRDEEDLDDEGLRVSAKEALKKLT
jgi:hypothetical protein